MFTGLIEEIGTLGSIQKQDKGAVLRINCSKILDDLKPGDSVAVDGACQTATRIFDNGFEAEASKETLDLTTFREYKPGRKLNLERAMSAQSRFGGHIVTGHIDGTGKFEKKEQDGLAWNFYFSAPENISRYFVYKGSVTINGISLTIAKLDKNIFSVAVIPTTINETTLSELSNGDIVNLETDILAKYVEKFTSKYDNTTGKITENYLKEHGFWNG